MLVALFENMDCYNAILHRYDGFSFHFSLKNMLAINTSLLSCETHTTTGKFSEKSVMHILREHNKSFEAE